MTHRDTAAVTEDIWARQPTVPASSDELRVIREAVDHAWYRCGLRWPRVEFHMAVFEEYQNLNGLTVRGRPPIRIFLRPRLDLNTLRSTVWHELAHASHPLTIDRRESEIEAQQFEARALAAWTLK